jgi:hypothetical protein
MVPNPRRAKGQGAARKPGSLVESTLGGSLRKCLGELHTYVNYYGVYRDRHWSEPASEIVPLHLSLHLSVHLSVRLSVLGLLSST